MNTKIAAITTIALGTSILGAAIYIAKSNESSETATQNELLATNDSLFTPAPSPTYTPDTPTQKTPEPAPKQTGRVIPQGTTGKTGFAAMMDRMVEFDLDGDGILSDLEKMAMGLQLRKEWMEKYDLDGDGDISPEEMEAFQVEQFINSERGQAMMRQFDADGDGILNATEEAALRERLAEMEEEKRLEDIAEYDTDQDGVLSDAERRVQRQEQRQYWANAMENAVQNHDRDGDGELNIEESQDAWDAWIDQQSINEFVNRYDANNDGTMGSSDYTEFLSNYTAGDLSADVNRDGAINALDLNAYTDLVIRANN
tara:strand:- start:25337 stop:26278 length:942 start_codon:yes stop_codon:yes gene_type:complete